VKLIVEIETPGDKIGICALREALRQIGASMTGHDYIVDDQDDMPLVAAVYTKDYFTDGTVSAILMRGRKDSQ
jgi:hypothetical protein